MREAVSYWRPIDSRTLGDERVRKLSAPPPNARDLWIHLLTRPAHELPGIQVGGVLSLAEELAWDVEGTKAAMEEIVDAGLAEYDAEARVIFLPKAMKLRVEDGPRPQAPNVIKSWRKPFNNLPDSPLLDKWLRTVHAATQSMGDAFAKAFADTFGEAFRRVSPISQGQGQGQEEESPTALELPKAAASRVPCVESSPPPAAAARERKRDYAKAMARERAGEQRAAEAGRRPPSDLVSSSSALAEALPARPRDGPPG